MNHNLFLHMTTPQFLTAITLATWMTWFPVMIMTTNLYKTKK